MDIESILVVKGKAVSTIRPEARVAEAARRMREERIGVLVISDDGRRILGIISDRGVMHAIVEHGVGIMDQPVESVMAREVVTCSPRDRIGSIMRLMTDRRIRHVPVVEDGQLSGIISIGDVVKSRIGELEFERDQLDHYVHQT